MTESVYIHIPFCKSKCKYCSFVSFTNFDDIDKYINALIKEIKYYYQLNNLKTIYFGGGTPSLLNPIAIEKILRNLKFSSDTEITFEINPDDTNVNYLKILRGLGINRLSFGAQSFNNEILKEIGRRHNSTDILKSIDYAHNSDFENINIDLIYGLPNQTMELLKKDLETIKKLDIKHISTYGLKIEQPSFYYYNKPKNLPNDDKQADMYIEINNYLESINYKRYEVSNFATEGYESKHNLNYWNNAEYYGFGVAAHGYKDGVRFSNTTDIKNYIKNPLKHENEHIVSTKEKLEEEIFLGFRREKGINIEEINKKYNIDFLKKYEKILDMYVPDYILPTETGYKLTLNGVLLSNNILAEFIDL